MAKKSLGYVRLEWTCPFCDTRNPGPQKKCSQCQAPQPADVAFEQAVEEELIEDQLAIKQAEAGPDIHCPFCNTRNPAGTTVCLNCQADLSGAEARTSGRVLGDHRDQTAADIPCPYCGTGNAATALQCVQCGASIAKPDLKPEPKQTALTGTKVAGRKTTSPLIFVAIAVLLVLCISVSLLYLRTDDVTGLVTDASWTLSIGIEELGPVSYEAWYDDLPPDSTLLSCRQEMHHTQDQPTSGSVEVCGEAYTVDDGTGFGEVVQDCHYQVFADFCEYTVDEWRLVDQIVQRGRDSAPHWPDVQLGSLQREGERTEEYEIRFDSDGQTYTFHTGSANLFAQCEIGSHWILEVNALNTVLGIKPDG